MSGIIGKLSFDSRETLARPSVEQMLEAISHRGCHARGIFTAPGVALGWCADHDVPPGSPVPAGEDAPVRVVADCTLTNARELRALLEREGHTFDGGTDGEIIAHAYEQWGDACVEHLDGAFACAIWDGRRRRLLLARDHAGLRPLYFALLHGHGVVFASEIRALLQDPGVGREWCPEAIDAYLALGYVPAPLTAYRRVSKLEPAQRLVVEGRRFHLEQFWDLPEPGTRWGRSGAATERLAGEIATTLNTCLRRVMHQDATRVGVNGTLYSGGTASAVLLAADAAHTGTVVTVALDQDTREVARSHELAQALGCDPLIEVAAPGIAAVARHLASHLDEPVADPSAVAQYVVCAAARAHTDHAFAAHGAAALWAGDARRRVGPTGATRHPHAIWDDDCRRSIYTRAFAWQVREANPFLRHLELYTSRDSGDPIDRALYVDARTFLPDNTVVIAERAALAAGMRLRFPFLDRATMALAAQVPGSFKHRDTAGMEILRAILGRRVRPSLMPAARPVPTAHRWLHEAIAALVPPMLIARRFDCRGIVSRPALLQLWDEHVSGRRDHARRFWALVMLEFWFREFIDGDAAQEPIEYAVLKAA